MSMSEIYVSTDVEADGPIAGPHSMLSPGSAAYKTDKTLIQRSRPIWRHYPEPKATLKRWPGGEESLMPGKRAGRI